MNYYKCINCGFNVTSQDERCQNCGVLKPLESLANNEKKFDEKKADETLVYVIIGVAFIPLAIIFGVKAGFPGVICCAVPLGIVAAIFITPIAGIINAIIQLFFIKSSNKKIENRNREIAERKAPHSESLIFKENLINQRKIELSKRELQITTVLSKAKLNVEEKWKQVSAMLENSIKTLKRQEAKYNLKSAEIDMVRLQNKIAPFVYNTDGFSYNQIDSNLKIIEEVKGTSFGIGNTINNESKFLDDSSEPKELIQRFKEIQSSIDKLHDAYLGKQAVLALQDINPVDDASNPILPPVKAIQESEVFNIQVSITDFSESLKELESEYMRVQAEEDIAKQVDKLINETNKPI